MVLTHRLCAVARAGIATLALLNCSCRTRAGAQNQTTDEIESQIRRELHDQTALESSQIAKRTADQSTAEAEKIYQLAVQALAQEKPDEALSHLSRAIAISPDYQAAYRTRSEVYLEKAQSLVDANDIPVRREVARKALVDAERAVELDRNDARAFFNRAWCHYSLGQTTQAVEDFGRVVELEPEHKEAQRAIRTLAGGIFADLFPAASNPGRKASSPAGPIAQRERPTVLEERAMLPTLPGTPNSPVVPVGGERLNVLHYAIVDQASRTVTLVGEFNPHWPTDPIPYWEHFRAAWQASGPIVNLETPRQEWNRLQTQVLREDFITKLLRRAGSNEQADFLIMFLLQANLGWTLDEALERTLRLRGMDGEEVQLAELVRLHGALEQTLTKTGCWLPPQFLSRFGDVVPRTPVQLGGVPLDSQLARVLLQADYSLKLAATWAPLRRHINGYLTFAEFCWQRGVVPADTFEQIIRLELEPDRIEIVKIHQQDKLIFRFGESRMKIVGGHLKGKEDQRQTKAIEAYASQLTQQYNGLEEWFPVLHELREAAKILALVHFLRQQKIALSFPVATWNRWEAPANVPGIVQVVTFKVDSLGKSRENNVFFEIHGGVDLTKLKDCILSVPSEQGGAVPIAIRDLDTKAQMARQPVVADRLYQAQSIPLSIDDQANRRLTAPLPTDKEALQKMLQGLRKELDETQRGLGRLSGSFNPAETEQEREELERMIREAQKESMKRYLEVAPEAMMAHYKNCVHAAEKETHLALDQYINARDPARREQLRHAFHWLHKELNEMRQFHDTIVPTMLHVNDFATLSEATLTPPEDRQKELEHLYDTLTVGLNNPLVQKALSIGTVPGQVATFGKVYADTGYDLLSEYYACSRISQMNRNSEEYLRAVRQLHDRTKTLVNTIKNVDAALERR